MHGPLCGGTRPIQHATMREHGRRVAGRRAQSAKYGTVCSRSLQPLGFRSRTPRLMRCRAPLTVGEDDERVSAEPRLARAAEWREIHESETEILRTAAL